MPLLSWAWDAGDWFALVLIAASLALLLIEAT
jgi:hypothetical protein